MRGLAEIKYVNEEECKAIKVRELEAKKKEVEGRASRPHNLIVGCLMFQALIVFML